MCCNYHFCYVGKKRWFKKRIEQVHFKKDGTFFVVDFIEFTNTCLIQWRLLECYSIHKVIVYGVVYGTVVDKLKQNGIGNWLK